MLALVVCIYIYFSCSKLKLLINTCRLCISFLLPIKLTAQLERHKAAFTKKLKNIVVIIHHAILMDAVVLIMKLLTLIIIFYATTVIQLLVLSTLSGAPATCLQLIAIFVKLTYHQLRQLQFIFHLLAME